MAGEHASVLQGSSLALTARDVQRHSVLVVGEHVVELHPEGARARDLQWQTMAYARAVRHMAERERITSPKRTDNFGPDGRA
jgi:hypothetical protein